MKGKKVVNFDANVQDLQKKAKAIWGKMNESEKAGVRFGLFPAGTMQEAEKQGYNGHDLCCALMNCAKNDGGMRA